MKKTIIILGLLITLSVNVLAQSNRINQLVKFAMSAQERGDYENALNAYSEAIRLGETSRNIKGLRGGCAFSIIYKYVEKGNYQAADGFINKLLAEEPNDAQYNGVKAFLLQDWGKYDEALTYYKRAINLDPTEYEGYVSLGNFLYFRAKDDNKNGLKTSAIEKYTQALYNFRRAMELVQNYYNPSISSEMATAIQETKDIIQEDINNCENELKKIR